MTLLTVIAPPAAAETRIALVIGNGAYETAPLGSPKEDAKAVEAKLKALGFQVTRKTDLGRDDLHQTIREFGERLQQPGAVGVFYYSGHGMQVSNRNYMIPTGVSIRDEADVELYGVQVENVLRRMELAGSNPNIVILDACRNNPFEKRFKSAPDGLAPMRPPTSTLIAFAAAPGTVAEAGAGGKLSPYTQALIETIETPGQDIIKMFQTVQNTVWQRTNGKQNPHVEFSPGLPDFSFQAASAAVPPAAAPPSVPTPAVKPAGGVYAGQAFKDCDACPEMVVIPAGNFLMGSADSDPDARDSEKPQHRVTVDRAFAIGKYEVAFEEWYAYAAADGKVSDTAYHNVWGRRRQPVMSISWYAAQSYVKWLTSKTGKPYRLPTEAEWEYAARAGIENIFVFRNNIKSSDANYFHSGNPVTTDVGTYPPNAWGLYDVMGNVSEWVEDQWHDHYHGAPGNGLAWVNDEEPQSYQERVSRGGNFSSLPINVRIASRSRASPNFASITMGFRVARDLE